MFLVPFFLSFFMSFSVFAKLSPLKELPYSPPKNLNEARENYRQTRENIRSAKKLTEKDASEMSRKLSEFARIQSEMDKLIMGQQHDFIELRRHFELKRARMNRYFEDLEKLTEKAFSSTNNYMSAVIQSFDARATYSEWKEKDTTHLDASP